MRNLQNEMEKAIKLINEKVATMAMLEEYFESRMAEGNELEIIESSCVAGQEYRELLAEVEKLMAVVEAIEAEMAQEEAEVEEIAEEAEVQEVEEQTTGAFVGSIFGVVGENTELDNLIEGFIQGKKPREKFS